MKSTSQGAFQTATRLRSCDDRWVVGDADVAQARVLESALRDHIGTMACRLAKVEDHPGAGQTHRGLTMRREASDLRRDIVKARFLIDQLHRRYPDLQRPKGFNEATG
jgi:hypothetical protein